MGEAGGCIFGRSLQAGWVLGHKNSRQVAWLCLGREGPSWRGHPSVLNRGFSSHWI